MNYFFNGKVAAPAPGVAHGCKCWQAWAVRRERNGRTAACSGGDWDGVLHRHSPRYWTRTARKAFARQVLTIGVEPIGFVCAVAVFVGISVVVQLTFWVGEAGQSQLLGPLLVTVVARELGRY